ncbi:predicted protein [Aspergillus nidulans FGSC A4]|uniref:Uncharacterized protein n=1 Tax=Emericella nidulans (strain FGSC A4 / ATCC 38163 / CBS 112.46 / NRRL 194 / M139) TaxID=227321 RepID=Q5AW21_EMENI|nr:hypothetical protein [Aspergillus nidulans FGSC A4]EAA62089.1 predicted protein [Aspergillus nidulans FGSC A4]CBF79525.1 TPA: conserved hypothetical protein [Aspergillus nidulans FGSC A4]|eukprot:XP_680778.1 predicted protein [Aspergillus nidulans FGSC A4]
MTPDKAYPQAERDRLIGIASRPATEVPRAFNRSRGTPQVSAAIWLEAESYCCAAIGQPQGSVYPISHTQVTSPRQLRANPSTVTLARYLRGKNGENGDSRPGFSGDSPMLNGVNITAGSDSCPGRFLARNPGAARVVGSQTESRAGMKGLGTDDRPAEENVIPVKGARLRAPASRGFVHAFLDLLGLLVGPVMLQDDNPSRTTRRRSTVRTDRPASRRMASGDQGHGDLTSPLFTAIHGTGHLPLRTSYITTRRRSVAHPTRHPGISGL